MKPNAETARRPLTRRDFLHGATVGALGATLAGAAGSSLFAQEPKEPKVVVVRNEQALDVEGRASQQAVDEMLAAAMKELTGRDGAAAWKQFVKPADLVGIKANVMMTPTHFEVLRAIVNGVTLAGAKPDKIVAWDRWQGGTSLEQIRALVERKAVGGASPFRIPFGDDDVSTLVTQKATVLINVPGLKSHWLSGIGVAIKNWCGAVTRINVRDNNTRFVIHKDHCARVGMINALPAIRDKQRLIIVDALRPLFEGGPQVDPRYLWGYNGLIVGTDPVAVDAVCLAIIQAKRDAYRGRKWPVQPPAMHVSVAENEFNLGVSDLARINVRKIGWEEGRLI